MSLEIWKIKPVGHFVLIGLPRLQIKYYKKKTHYYVRDASANLVKTNFKKHVSISSFSVKKSYFEEIL